VVLAAIGNTSFFLIFLVVFVDHKRSDIYKR
jgi:hypothetical protein